MEFAAGFAVAAGAGLVAVAAIAVAVFAVDNLAAVTTKEGDSPISNRFRYLLQWILMTQSC